uniref:Lipocalin 2 n=1 Tax=Rhipicephalus microplus TaxID=6941 RepID=A0A034WXV7_RHIMP
MRAAIPSLLVVGVVLWLDAPLAQGEAKHRLQHNVTDAFKMFRNSPVAVAMFDTDNDGDLDCLTTVRSNFDEEGHKATYTWLLPGVNGHERRNVTFDLREGPSPDKTVFTPEDGDGSEQIANFIYSDNERCTVLEIPYKNVQECILWMNPKDLKAVPQHCLDYYEDNCDMQNPAYDEESCGPLISNL